jgi:hypothetical protein
MHPQFHFLVQCKSHTMFFNLNDWRAYCATESKTFDKYFLKHWYVGVFNLSYLKFGVHNSRILNMIKHTDLNEADYNTGCL